MARFRQANCPCGRSPLTDQIKGELECPQCGKPVEFDFSDDVKANNFEPYWEEHIASNPVYIDSKATLEKEMRKTGVALTKGHTRAPEYCRQGSAMTPPTPAQRMSWLRDRS